MALNDVYQFDNRSYVVALSSRGQPAIAEGVALQLAINVEALCSRHHHGKHDAGSTPRRLDDGATEWSGPTGHRYVEEAATYPIDRTTDPPPY